MPYQKLSFKPGIDVNKTQLLNEGGWSFANCVRFREGLPEVLGGWVTLGIPTLVGVPRGTHAWSTLAGIPTLAVGSNVRLYVVQAVAITVPVNPFTTVMSSPNVTVNDPGAPSTLAAGDTILVSGATVVGGVTPDGPYTVLQVNSPGNYAIILNSSASSAATGGGTPTIQYAVTTNAEYDITPIVGNTAAIAPFTTTLGSNIVKVARTAGPINIAPGALVQISSGSPVGGLTLSGVYSVIAVFPAFFTIQAASAATSSATGGGTPSFGYGISGAVSSGTALSPMGPPQALTWTLDNFGEQLIACPWGNTIFVWLPATEGNVRATPITNAPAEVDAIFVSEGAEQVIALGSVPAAGGVFDPMLVSWCNSGDYTVWLASPANDAGDFHLTDGSQLMWGGRAGQQNLIWSDTALYGMQFIGGQLVYSFTQLGTACGLIGPLAGGIVNGLAAWMSRLNFMVYTGSVQVIDCPVRDLVFKNLNTLQSAKILCAVNSQFTEFRWDYPSSSGSGENDSYVIWNFIDNTWTYGSDAASGITIAGTAWEDVSAFGNPIRFDALGNGWVHENEDIYSAGTAEMPWSIESGYVDIAAGEEMMFVDQVLPDQILTGGTVDVTLSAQRYSADTPQTTSGAITSATQFVPGMRIRGRQVAVTFANGGGALNQFWRHAATRIRAAPDGRN